MKIIKGVLVVALAIIGMTGFTQEVRKVKITDVEKIIADSKTPLIISMWATWCAPCLEEIPYFQEEVAKHKKDSVRLYLLSLDFKDDYPAGITKIMKKLKIPESSWLDETNADYFCPKIDAKWSGAIPATLFVNNNTGYRSFHDQQVSPEALRKEISALLSKN